MKTFNHEFAENKLSQETFEEHLERMKALHRANDQDIPNQPPTVPDELQNILPNLMKIGYLLNLIQERSTVLLSPNWQN